MDTAKLRALALAATPGPWEWRVLKLYAPEANLPRTVIDMAHGGCAADDTTYIAAASPDVVLALLDQLSSATRELDRWRHGVPIEGDYVCPVSLELTETKRRLEEVTAERNALLEHMRAHFPARGSTLGDMTKIEEKLSDLADGVTGLKLDLGDPETRAVWESALGAKREVESWPEWKRGAQSRLSAIVDEAAARFDERPIGRASVETRRELATIVKVTNRTLMAEIGTLRSQIAAVTTALNEACDWIENDLDNHEAMVGQKMSIDRALLEAWRKAGAR